MGGEEEPRKRIIRDAALRPRLQGFEKRILYAVFRKGQRTGAQLSREGTGQPSSLLPGQPRQ